MNRVIITGPTGAIGMALIKKCIKKDVQILAIVNPASKRKKNIWSNPLIQVMEADICDYKSLEFDASYDVWFHLAWQGASGPNRDNMYLQNSNVTYLLDAIQAARKAGCHTFVGAGSQAEYGMSVMPLNGESPVFPTTGYGIAKLCAGQMGKVLCKSLGMRFIWPRIFSVYGPYDGENTMIMSAIRNMMRGISPKFTKAEQEWDYLYSDDAAEALYLLAEKGKSGKIYCIGNGNTHKLKEYIHIIKDVVNRQVEPSIGALPYAENQLMYLCADIKELTKDTGFYPRYDFKTGLIETYEWCRRQDKNEKS